MPSGTFSLPSAILLQEREFSALLSSGVKTQSRPSCGVTPVQLCSGGHRCEPKGPRGQRDCIWTAVSALLKFPKNGPFPSGLPWNQLQVQEKVKGRWQVNQGLLVPRFSLAKRNEAPVDTGLTARVDPFWGPSQASPAAEGEHGCISRWHQQRNAPANPREQEEKSDLCGFKPRDWRPICHTVKLTEAPSQHLLPWLSLLTQASRFPP